MKKIISVLALLCLIRVLFAQELKPITLNPPDLKRGLPVMEAFSLRASVREFTDTRLSLQDLSDLLWAANGVNRKEIGKRTAPSAMNTQDIDIYVFMEEGAYLYDAFSHVLNPVVSGDHRGIFSGPQPNATKPSVILVMVSDISKFKIPDEAQKLRGAAMDASFVSQNICLFCAGMGLSTRPRAGMDIEKVRSVLQLKDTQHPILNNPVSYPVK